MMSAENKAEADRFYNEAKQYNLRDKPGDAALARSLFASAARLGHVQATCDLAGMMFEGFGGPKEQAKAMAIKWQAFASNDVEPLEELSELLHSYADALTDPAEKRRALSAAEKADQAFELLRYVSIFVRELDLHRLSKDEAK
jgi:TPR repeat protein